jgi:hypothetical protein
LSGEQIRLLLVPALDGRTQFSERVAALVREFAGGLGEAIPHATFDVRRPGHWRCGK